MRLNACHLGSVPYGRGLALQESLVQARALGETGDWLLFPDHPPVVTIGRAGSEASLLVDRAGLEVRGIEVFEVTRGGDVTWHGPGQLVGYPILGLEGRFRDLHRVLRGLERALIRTLDGFGILAEVSPGRTGVWTGGRKIASIGIAVRRWVSYHGFALNVDADLGHFDLMHPCGLRGVRMTSMAECLGTGCPSLAEAREAAASAVADEFEFDPPQWMEPAGAWRWIESEVARAASGAAPSGTRAA